MVEVKVIADSISGDGVRITTLQLRYWRAFHSEFMTHRAFSRSASSSRAIPVKKVLQQVWNDPAGPIHWGANQAGMQAQGELNGWRRSAAKSLWKWTGRAACVVAWTFSKIGLHKQVANRILEPWQYISVVVTATEWINFFHLRDHPAAMPEIRELAQAIQSAMRASFPVIREPEDGVEAWHLPYITKAERSFGVAGETLAKFSAARCARVSYLNHDGKEPCLSDDLKLFEKLAFNVPPHASPMEHQAVAAQSADVRSGNLHGWVQYRHQLGV